MARTFLGVAGRDLNRLFREGSLASASDAELLEGFTTDRADSALEALVARHEAMVRRV